MFLRRIELQGQGLIHSQRGCSNSQAGVRSIQDLNRFNLVSTQITKQFQVPKVEVLYLIYYQAFLGDGVSLT